ncbi:MAG: metal-dependent transcriptional regulator [Ignavibacteriae bacterium]|nr:MAG: metal-dependent transcriptional regulator [Ignavibacteriota bacterium]
MKNISKEDYLSTIFKNRDSDGIIKGNQIAEKLDISNAAVTDMLKKLSNDGFVDHKRYRGIKLTGEGEEYARNMVRRHRIWEVFLHQVVGLPWDQVHDEAENLEHSSSDELINRMEEMLDFPEFDPHGNPIPDKNGNLPEQSQGVSLNSVSPGTNAVVLRINDINNNFLNYISQIGLELNKEIEVKEFLDYDNSVLILIDGREVNLSNKLASNIFVIQS